MILDRSYPEFKTWQSWPDISTHGFHINSRVTITACSMNNIISNLLRILRMRSSEDRNKYELITEVYDIDIMLCMYTCNTRRCCCVWAVQPFYKPFYISGHIKHGQLFTLLQGFPIWGSLPIFCVPFNFCPEADNCSSWIRGWGRMNVVIILSQNLNNRIS